MTDNDDDDDSKRICSTKNVENTMEQKLNIKN